MAPPLGRLRVLQSLEVDEDDAEYQRKKQETQQTLKSTFEAIFEKYSNVADHETDEVDLHAGTIVVDNGHLRKLAKDPKVRERWMALGEIMEDEFEDGDSDSEDELAELAMPPITIRRKVSSSEPASSPLQVCFKHYAIRRDADTARILNPMIPPQPKPCQTCHPSHSIQPNYSAP